MGGLAVTRRSAAGRERARRWALLGPALATILVIGIAPIAIILVYSFLVPGAYGGVIWQFTWSNYVQFLYQQDFDGTLLFDSAYLVIIGRSAAQALFATLACLAIGFPTAYFMATRSPRWRSVWMFLVTIPFWTNLLIRTYAIMLFVQDQGFINQVLLGLGVIDHPLQLNYTNFAIGLGLTYTFLPYMVLPIFASLEKLDFRVVEAGFDLYATRFQVLRRIIIPLAKPGIVAGCLLVFIPSVGAYVTSELLGGGRKLLVGNLIAHQFGNARNWSFGSALTIILMAGVLLALWVYVRQGMRAEARHA